MARPTYFPDWANETVNLPGTGNTNKIRPKQTIRDYGMDYGQIMTCEELNWWLNNVGSWIHYIIEEYFPTLPNTYLPLVGTKITLSGDATGSVTWNGNAAVNLAVNVVDNSHNHLSANITDAAVGPIGNVLVKRDSNGSIYATDFVARSMNSSDGATVYFQNQNGINTAYITVSPISGGVMQLLKLNPANNAGTAVINIFDAGYIEITNPRTTLPQEGAANSLVRFDYYWANLNNVQSTLQNNINNAFNNLQAQITNNYNFIVGNWVLDVRLGSVVRQRYGDGEYTVPAGYVMVGGGFASDSNQVFISAPLQKNINNTWYTVGQL